MNVIQSLYIPNIEKHINADFIANVFSKNKLARVSKVYIEHPRANYNRAYIEIDYWHETGAAYSFIKSLLNHNVESRLIYCDDNWWVVRVNTWLSTFASNNRVLTIFKNSETENCATHTTYSMTHPIEKLENEFKPLKI